MLDPRERTLLFEALRPPPGCSFDRAVGTTFSLDPTALLAVPLAFAAFDVETETRVPHDDSLALLEAVRRNARHISLFCQAGRIAVPARYRSLLTYLERSVIEVVAPRDGYVFHPKTWLVRYRGSDGEVVYRFLCLSRNLTFDRSWDTVLTLEGVLTARTHAFAVNHPLGDFLAALPGLAVREMPQESARNVALMQNEVRRVRFEPPEGFTGFSFRPLGLSRRTVWPFPARCTRGLVVSPFLSAGCLDRLPGGGGLTLVSRIESLGEMMPHELGRMQDCYSLSEAADPETDDTGATTAGDSTSDEGGLSGLHAKLFVFDQRGQTSLWTGSANATTNAFEGNVEFLVELRGPRRFCGAEQTLGDDDVGLRTLLEPYTPAEPPPGDPAQRRLDHLLDRCRSLVAALPLRLRLEPSGSADSWHATLERDGAAGETMLPVPTKVTAWPITVPGRAAACDLDADVVADFGVLSLEALTPFVAFSLHAESANGSTAEAVFVANVLLVGAPPGRSALVLRELLRRPGDLVALLLLLLADDHLGLIDALSARGDAEPSSPWHGFSTTCLFEALVGALARDPEKLRTVRRLVEELRVADDEARATAATACALGEAGAGMDVPALLPEGFDEIWEPVWAAARALGVADVAEADDV